MAQKRRNEGDGPIDLMLSPDLIDNSSPESVVVKWLQDIGADSSLPSIFQGSGFKETLILRHLKVDRMELGLVIFTLTIKSPITNRYRTSLGGADKEPAEQEQPIAKPQKTSKFMTKYERARILDTRALQISMNVPVMVELEGKTVHWRLQ